MRCARAAVAAHVSSTATAETPEDRRSSAVTESPGDPGVLADTRHAVREALKSLPDQQRIPLEMAYFEGMTHTEIAESLNQPLGTMKDRIRTGMSHLRRQLKAYL
jgi:RNA polymerase sigma-70 factor (ECF subfamily)